MPVDEVSLFRNSLSFDQALESKLFLQAKRSTFFSKDFPVTTGTRVAELAIPREPVKLIAGFVFGGNGAQLQLTAGGGTAQIYRWEAIGKDDAFGSTGVINSGGTVITMTGSRRQLYLEGMFAGPFTLQFNMSYANLLAGSYICLI